MNNLTIGELIEKYPFVTGFFEANKLDTGSFENKTFQEYLDNFSQGEIDDFHANSRIIPFRSRLFVRFYSCVC